MTREWVAPVFPAGYPRGQRLAPLLHSGIRDVKHGGSMRRDATRHDPLLFAMLYLPAYLTDERSGLISFSEFHLAAYNRMMRWASPVADRSGWASHRNAGKSVAWFLVGPLWAAAHGHRRFFLALSYTVDQVETHLANLRAPIEQGGLLLHDFPHLAPGRPWRSTAAVTKGGVRFQAASLEKTVLGARQREQRPDLIIGDDLEPGPDKWTAASKAKTLSRLVHDILPAGSRNAATVLTGTPVGMGSIMHDVGRAARGRGGALEDKGEWVTAKGFDPHWFPAITVDGRSAWPTRWPLAELEAERAADPEVFALQYQCDPDDPAVRKWWTDDTFQFAPHFGEDSSLWRIGSIDGAGSGGRSSRADHSAFVGVSVKGQWTQRPLVCVEEAASGLWDPETELLPRIWRWAQRFPRSRKTLIVEGNGAGATLAQLLTRCGLPPDVELIDPFHVDQDKAERIGGLHVCSLLYEYRRGVVLHLGNLTALQAQMVAWRPGASGHGVDDLIDATAAAVRYALYGDAARVPARC